MTEQIKLVLENLEKNNMSALYFENSAAAREYLKNTLKKGASVSGGGSMSVIDSGITDILTGGDYVFLDRFSAKGPQDAVEIYKQILGADYYFCSANAVTEKGEIVNVDGLGNRVSASVFGPKQVFMVVGINKIVKDVPAAFLRIKTVAAPKNAVRLSCDTPCAKTGKCVSLLKSDNPDITDGCNSPRRICRDYLVMGKQREKGRITVLLINEELGY